MQLPSEIEEEILKKADRIQTNAKGGQPPKKDAKKPKEDPKAAKGAANKKGGAAKSEEVKPDMKVNKQIISLQKNSLLMNVTV